MKIDMTYSLWKVVIPLALITPWLSGCGGDDDAPAPAATTSVPASASASVAGFIAYLNLLVVVSPDNLEPVDMAAVTPPTEENSEPQPLNSRCDMIERSLPVGPTRRIDGGLFSLSPLHEQLKAGRPR